MKTTAVTGALRAADFMLAIGTDVLNPALDGTIRFR
jgi:hypothetical protein